MKPEHIRHLLESHKRDEISIDDVLAQFKVLPSQEVGYANIDHHRKIRNGYPEVMFGEGKSPEQAAEIFMHLSDSNDNILCARASEQMADAIRQAVPAAVHHREGRIVELRRERREGIGLVIVATGGTSDIPVAEEAALVLDAFGTKVERLYDAGAGGFHRLLTHAGLVRRANCVVAVAGMEGALPSVVGGIVDVPVVAVPTSLGCGASFGGIAALLAMLNSCAFGVSVVNIGNGFGAAYQADMINKLAAGGVGKERK